MDKNRDVQIEQRRRKKINDGFQELKKSIGLDVGIRNSKYQFLQEALNYVHNLKTKNEVILYDNNEIKAINEVLKSKVSCLEKLLSDLQNNVATNKKSNGSLKGSLQENEELRSKNYNLSHIDFIEGLTKGFTAEIINEITKLQNENDKLIRDNLTLKSNDLSLNSEIQSLKSCNAELLLEKKSSTSQLNELAELKSKNESMKFETKVLHTEVDKLQQQINELNINNQNENRILTIENNNLKEKIHNMEVQYQQLKKKVDSLKKEVIQSNQIRPFNSELEFKDRYINDLFSKNCLLTAMKNNLQSENNNIKQDINEKDAEIKKLIDKISELEQIITIEKIKVEVVICLIRFKSIQIILITKNYAK